MQQSEKYNISLLSLEELKYKVKEIGITQVPQNCTLVQFFSKCTQ